MLGLLLQLRDRGAESMVPWPVGWAERRTAAAYAGGMRLVNAIEGCRLQNKRWTCNDIVGLRESSAIT